MAKEIKQKIVLEGEKQYNQAIKEAQRNLKTLKSELKAETAELGKNATEQQKAEAKVKSLKQQIKEQEKIVRTLKDALQEAREKYGDNADEIAKWEQKLNNARTTLANMKNDLAGVGDGLKKAETGAQLGTVATKSYADSLGKVADAGEAVSSTIEGIFTGMVSTVGEAIATVWDDMVDLAARANAWMDLAGFWNTDAETIQKWARSVESAHNSFSDLQNAVTRINMGDQKKITQATGVSGENYTDKWQYAMAVMDSLASMDYEKRLEAAGEVFGEKRATKVLDILNEWSKIQNNLKDFDVSQGGVGLTNEQMDNMATLAEQVDHIEQTWRVFLDKFEAEHLGKLALDLTGNAQRILDDLIKYLDTGDDQDLEQLEKDITEFFDRIKEALEAAAQKLDEAGKKLEESDNGIVRAIGKALQGIAGALEWISDDKNIEKVIGAFETLAAFWLVGKGVSLVNTIAGLAANIKIIQGFSMAGAATGAAAGAAGSGAAGGGGGIISTIMGAIAKAVPWLLGGGLVVNDSLNNHGNAEAADENGYNPEGYYIDENGNGYSTRTTPEDGQKYTGYQMEKIQELWDAAREHEEWKTFEQNREDRHVLPEEYSEIQELTAATLLGNDEIRELLQSLRDFMAENEDWRGIEDLPADWWRNPGGTTDENGITAADLQGFLGLPRSILAAVLQGARQGVSGIKVDLDGRRVGELVAPYVSEEIAKSIP